MTQTCMDQLLNVSNTSSSERRELRKREKLDLNRIPKTTNEGTKTQEEVALRRDLGYFSCVGILVGSIIGSGIFVTPQGVLKGSGSVGLTLVIWFLCGIYAFLGGLTCAELGNLIPTSGGMFMYFLECFAPNRKTEKLFWGPLVAFLYSWYFNVFARPAVFAIQGMSCAKYLLRLSIIGCPYEERKQISELETKLLATCIMFLITVLNCCSVKFSTRVVNFFTVTKLSALFIIITGGIVQLSHGHNETLKTGFEGSKWSYGGISLAFYSGLWPYAGWDKLNMVTRELENPKRDFLRSVMTSVFIITVFYVLTNVSYFILMTKEEMLESEEVAVDCGEKLLGEFGVIIMVFFVTSSIFGSVSGGMFLNTRLCYAAAREGHMLDFLSFLNIKRMTPVPALIFTFTIALLLMCHSDILGLVFFNGFIGNIFMCITMISLLIMRKTKKHIERVVTVPTFAPVLIFLFSLFLLVAPFIEKFKLEYFYGVLFLFVGILIYVIFVYYELRVPGFGIIKTFIQKILLVVPPEDDEV